MSATTYPAGHLPSADWRNQVESDTRRVTRRGLMVIGGFVLLFGAWTALVPLAGAIIGQGSIVSAGQNSMLQHPTGGKITAVHVRDGQTVKKGDIVFSLNPTLEASTLNRFKERHKLLTAQEARLKTMIARAAKGDFPADAIAATAELRTSEEGQSLSAAQNLELVSGLQRHQEEIRSLEGQIDAQKANIAGLKSRIKGLSEQSQSIKVQLNRQRQLAEQGYFPANRVAEAERQAQEIESTLASTTESRNGALAELAGLQAKRSAAMASFNETLSQQLSDVSTQAAELDNQIKGAEDQLQQADIRSPVDGTLVKLTNQTIGGVIRGGETVGEIVPAGAALLAEVRLDTKDIVHVAKGEKAEVVFSAFNRHLTDPVPGEVVYVSPDALLDERQGIHYFLARIAFDPKAKQLSKQDVQPGMTAEVYIDADSRSFLSYLLKPVSDSFRRAFREP